MRREAAEKTAREGVHVWRVPVLLGLVSLIGLVSALIGDDVYDVLSWCLLALPLLAIVRALRMAK